MKTRSTPVVGQALAVLGLAAVLAGCGDDKGTTPTTPTTTTPTVTTPAVTPLAQGNELVPARQLYLRDIVVPTAGRLDLTIEYTFADSDILFWLTNRKCSRQMFDNDSCDYLTKSLGGTSPRTASAAVQPGTYTLIVHNNGTHDEQIRYRFVLTP